MNISATNRITLYVTAQSAPYKERRLEIKLNTNAMTASTSRRWSRPPKVYEVSIPNSHITTKIIMIVFILFFSPLLLFIFIYNSTLSGNFLESRKFNSSKIAHIIDVIISPVVS